MGSIYQSRRFGGCERSKLEEAVQGAMDDDVHEHGHGPYSGAWGEKRAYGLIVEERRFEDLDEAEDYVSDHTDKHGPLLAVKVSRPVDRKHYEADAEYGRLRQRLDAEAKKIGFGPGSGMDGEVLRRVRSAKTRYRSCEGCGSRISVEHLHGTTCPVCGKQEFVYTETDRKRRQAQQEKVQSLHKRLDERRAVIAERVRKKEGDRWIWYVGGWCSS